MSTLGELLVIELTVPTGKQRGVNVLGSAVVVLAGKMAVVVVLVVEVGRVVVGGGGL